MLEAKRGNDQELYYVRLLLQKQLRINVLTSTFHFPVLKCLNCACFQVEKARQRIAQGKRTSMYTTKSSINAKVGEVLGWQEMLSMVGFRFELATGDLPDSVFFPSTDHVGILNRCSNTLYAFLGMFF